MSQQESGRRLREEKQWDDGWPGRGRDLQVRRKSRRQKVSFLHAGHACRPLPERYGTELVSYSSQLPPFHDRCAERDPCASRIMRRSIDLASFHVSRSEARAFACAIAPFPFYPHCWNGRYYGRGQACQGPERRHSASHHLNEERGSVHEHIQRVARDVFCHLLLHLDLQQLCGIPLYKRQHVRGASNRDAVF